VTDQIVSEFHSRAAAMALVVLFREKHFNICTLDAIARTIGRQASCAGRDYDALRAIHCVDWADMGPELTRMAREKCLEILGLPAQIVEEVKEETTEPKASGLVRLAFWRKP